MLLANQNPQGRFKSFPKILRSDICDLKPEIIRAIHLAGKRPDTYFVDIKTAQSIKVGQSVKFGNNETFVTAKEFDSRYDEYQVQATMVDLDYGATKIGEVSKAAAGRVLMKTAYGSTRVVYVLAGEMLPRIC